MSTRASLKRYPKDVAAMLYKKSIAEQSAKLVEVEPTGGYIVLKPDGGEEWKKQKQRNVTS